MKRRSHLISFIICNDLLLLADARKIPMGVLVEELDHAAEDLIIAANNMKKYSRRMNEIEDMAAEEIVQVYLSFIPWLFVLF